MASLQLPVKYSQLPVLLTSRFGTLIWHIVRALAYSGEHMYSACVQCMLFGSDALDTIIWTSSVSAHSLPPNFLLFQSLDNTPVIPFSAIFHSEYIVSPAQYCQPPIMPHCSWFYSRHFLARKSILCREELAGCGKKGLANSELWEKGLRDGLPASTGWRVMEKGPGWVIMYGEWRVIDWVMHEGYIGRWWGADHSPADLPRLFGALCLLLLAPWIL